MDKLPAEVILAIHTHQDLADLCSLVRVCRRLYQTLNLELYKRDVKTGSPQSLFWAAMFGLLGTLKMSHAAGANLEQAWASDMFIFPSISHCTIAGSTRTFEFETSLKKHYNKFFKHSPETYSYLFNGEKLSPAWEQRLPTFYDSFYDFNDDHPSAPKTASKDCLTPYANNFLDRPNFIQACRGKRWPKYWWHALDLAVLFRHFDVIRYLLKNGVNIAKSHSRGLCSRLCACAGSDFEILSPKRVHNPLTLAACESDLAIQKILLENLGLRDMARALTWEEVQRHEYRADMFKKGSQEEKDFVDVHDMDRRGTCSAV